MGRWLGGIRVALRSLLRAPAFALSSVLLVGLGVGATTTVFTVVDHVLLRPLPYPDEDRLMHLTRGSHPGPVLRGVAGLESVDAWTAVFDEDTNLEPDTGDPMRLRQAAVTPSFFTMFGARPEAGRLLVEGDGNATDLAVVTHEAWQSIWGGDEALVGKTIRLDGTPVEVVGVLTPAFRPPETLAGRTLHIVRLMDWTDPTLDRPNVRRHAVAARLKPGVSLEAANQELEALGAALYEEFPDNFGNDGRVMPFPFEPLREYTAREASQGLNLLLGAVSLLMLVACANVAHLFLARGLGRQREMAVRRAMGAHTSSLVGHLSLESLLVGGGGALLGLALSAAALRAFGPWIREALPRGAGVALDLRVLAFATALAVVAALLFGLLPAARTLGRDPADQMRGGGRGVTSLRSVNLLRGGLVTVEVALSLVLVTMSGVLLRSFMEVTAQDPGVRVDGTWVIPVDFPTPPEVGQYAATMEEIKLGLAALPGVERVTYGLEAPFEWVGGSTCCWGNSFLIDDVEADDLGAMIHGVDEDFFATYDVELVAGRLWPRSESLPDPLPAVMAEALAVEIFGSAQAAVGRTGTLNGRESGGGFQIVGVAADTRYYGLDQGVDEALYLPVEAVPFPLDIGTFGVQASREGDGIARQLRQAVWQVRPSLPLPTVVPLDSWLTESAATRRFSALLTLAFGGVAWLLAAGGLYGTLLYAVQQRRKELGIRLALGAGRGRIEGQVLRRGVGLAVLGAAIGAVAAVALGRLLESFVYGVGPRDPLSLALSVVLLLATAALASWLPARRASRTDPLETLNAE
jgi:putative ABC transport system permease protein